MSAGLFGLAGALTGALARRRAATLCAWLIALAGAVGAGWWGGRRTLEPPADPIEAQRPVTYLVEEGSIGRVLSAAARTTWPEVATVRATQDGVITSLRTDRLTALASGDVVYELELYPVVIAEGTVPSFRELSTGARGEDVAQLQRLLASLGHYGGEVDGIYGNETRSAVRNWQESLGVEVNGAVPAGALAVVPDAPARLAFAADVAVGTTLRAGDPILTVLGPAPTFVLELPLDQYVQLPERAAVEVDGPEGVWRAVTGGARSGAGEGDTVEVVLEATGEGPICGERCALVPTGRATTYPARVTVVPARTGAVVPVAAVVARPDGSTAVIDATNRDHLPVDVVAADGGLAIVDGVEVGDRILLSPGTESGG